MSISIHVSSAIESTAVVVPFTDQQVRQLQEGLLEALCVPLLEATVNPQGEELDQAYRNHELTRPNRTFAVGETYMLTEKANCVQCHYLDGESVSHPKQSNLLNSVTASLVRNQWHTPSSMPLMLCRYYLPVTDSRDLRVSHVYRYENIGQLGIVEPAETLVCCHKFCGYKPIPGYEGPEQEPICCQKPETDYSFVLAFRQQWSDQHGQQSLLRDDYILWIDVDPPVLIN